MDLIYRYREPASMLTAGVLFLALSLGAGLKMAMQWKPVPSLAPVELSLFQETQPPPAPPTRVPPRVETRALAQPQATPTAAASPAPSTTASEPAATPQPPALPAQAAAPTPQAAPTTRAPVANADQSYLVKVRANVLARKKYPTGREASLLHPAGTVRIWLLLDRQGEVREVGVESSSNSLILDSEAAKLLRSGSYPAFPEDVFPGQATHRIYFDLDYKPAGAS